MHKLLTTLLFVVAIVATSCNGSRSNKSESETAQADTTAVQQTSEEPGDRGYIVAVGDLAPDFTIEVDNGTTFTLSQNRGKVVMLQFTASWCGICRREMPFIESDIWQRFGSNPDFVLLGVDRDETADKVAMMKEKTEVTYPIAYDVESNAFTLYAFPDAGITRNVLIDRDGKIVMLTRRYEEEEFAALCAKIAEMLGEN